MSANGNPQIIQNQNINNTIRHKIVKNTDPRVFETEMNELTGKGWTAVNVQSTIQWSEGCGEFKEFYLAILAKQGI